MTRLRACGAAIALLSCSAVAPIAEAPATFPQTAQASAVVRPPAPLPAAPALAATVKPSAPVALPAVSQGDIGTAGPLSLLGASASGAWVALCQGEPAAASLVLGSGTGERIDALLAQDPSGRYVVVQAGAQVSLIDTVEGTRVDLSALGADVRKAKLDYGAHRALSFDAGGLHLAYLRRHGTESQIVVRDLVLGTERSFAAGSGDVFRLRLSPDARYVVFDAIRADTTHNGKLDWPVPEDTSARPNCAKPGLPKLRSYAFLGRGDAVTRAVVSVADGAVRDVPELVTPLGARLVVREADGSLRLDQGGKRSSFAPASCAGRLLFADGEREQALVTCALPKKPGKREVWLFASGYSKNLQSELYETSTDREVATGVRLVALYPGSDASLFDLERRDVLPLLAGSRVIQTSGGLALIWRGSELFSYDAQSKRETRLAEGVLKNPELLVAGAAVLLSPFVIVGAAAPALSSPTAQPLAVSSTGHVLAASPSADAGATPRAIQGPLHWLDARLPPPDGPPR